VLKSHLDSIFFERIICEKARWGKDVGVVDLKIDTAEVRTASYQRKSLGEFY